MPNALDGDQASPTVRLWAIQGTFSMTDSHKLAQGASTGCPILCNTRFNRNSEMTNAELLTASIAVSGSRIMSTVHLKKDGTCRKTVFNPRHIGEVKGTGHPMRGAAAVNVFRVMDLTLNPPAWRAVDARRLVEVKVGGQVITTTVEE